MRTTLLAIPAALLLAGCSSGTWVKLPPGHHLSLYERPAKHDSGRVATRPFGWAAASGIPYKLTDGRNQVVQEGRLRARFRVVSIFVPPVAIAYWPMGYGQRCYDLTGDAPQTCTHQDLIDLRSQERLRR